MEAGSQVHGYNSLNAWHAASDWLMNLLYQPVADQDALVTPGAAIRHTLLKIIKVAAHCQSGLLSAVDVGLVDTSPTGHLEASNGSSACSTS